MEDYPNLNWWLQDLQILRQILDEYEENPGYLEYIDKIIYPLREKDCKGFKEKATEVSDIDKLPSTLSELIYANVFLDDYNIEFVKSGDWRGQSPDFIISNDEFKALIEVTRINDDGTSGRIIDYLRTILKNTGFSVDIELSERLQHPKLTYEERQEQDSLVEESLSQFEKEFSLLDKSKKSFVIESTDLRFSGKKTMSGKGYPGILNTGVFIVESEPIKDMIRRKILDKGEKRDSFENKYRNYPFIIAFDVNEGFIDEKHMDLCLYGETLELGDNNGKYSERRNAEWEFINNNLEECIPKWNEIQEAKENGWQIFLEKKYLIPNKYIFLTKPGIFLEKNCSKNVSGVILKTAPGEIFFFPESIL